jgi:hypothetical protein
LILRWKRWFLFLVSKSIKGFFEATMTEDNRVEVEIEINEETKANLVELVFAYPDKSLNEIIEEALVEMLDRIDKDPSLLEEVLEKK